MSGLLEERPLQWAEPLRPDRIVATAMLGLRPLRYVSEGVAAVGPAIEGLRVVAVGAAEIPVFHQSTGLYGFLHLPPGDRRIEISDPLQQLLAWAKESAAFVSKAREARPLTSCDGSEPPSRVGTRAASSRPFA